MGSAYPVLDPGQPIGVEVLGHLCALAVMAKAPRAGRVKTRLSPPLTLEQTATLNVAFLRDTTENLAGVVGGAGLISYTPVGDEELFAGLLPERFALVAQRGDGFGERLLAAAEDILAFGYGAVCLIDSDSPTVPSGGVRGGGCGACGSGGQGGAGAFVGWGVLPDWAEDGATGAVCGDQLEYGRRAGGDGGAVRGGGAGGGDAADVV